MLMKDKLQLQTWLKNGATLNDVMNVSRFGLVENERFTEHARDVYWWLWAWSAHRFEGPAGRLQNDIYCRYGTMALDRRIARVQRIIEKIKAGNF